MYCLEKKDAIKTMNGAAEAEKLCIPLKPAKAFQYLRDPRKSTNPFHLLPACQSSIELSICCHKEAFFLSQDANKWRAINATTGKLRTLATPLAVVVIPVSDNYPETSNISCDLTPEVERQGWWHLAHQSAHQVTIDVTNGLNTKQPEHVMAVTQLARANGSRINGKASGQ